MTTQEREQEQVHHTAWVHPSAVVEGLVGPRTQVCAGAVVTMHARVGADCVIGPGAVIGHTGFGYWRDEQGRWQPKPHTHGVVVEDGVHVGANACVDRGSWRDTVLGAGCRIDNLVHIAHNVRVGRDSLVIAGAVVCGSCDLGDGSYLAPGAVVRDHVTVGEEALVGLGAVVTRDVAPWQTVAGVPARPHG